MPPEPEIGSEFHWDPAALRVPRPGGSPDSWLPPGHALFATACGALSTLVRRLRPRGRLHVPSYFCMGVAEVLSAEVPLAWYRHLPGEPGPRLDTLRAVPGDLVLVQNLFGRDEPGPWQAWMRANPGVVVVEDHSHDPFSDWARDSTAAFAVASLRKTLPLPDGGLLWSPRGLDLPQPIGGESPGAGLKLTAMLLKAAWLDGRAVPKDAFRTLQRQGEAVLLGSAGPAAVATRAVLPLLDVPRLRAASARNARALIAALPAETADWRVLDNGPAGAAPFRVQLVCRSQALRDALRAHLVAHRIFAPVHWPQDRAGLWSGDDAAADLASRMLTMPVDHRYGLDEVRRVAHLLAPPARPSLAVRGEAAG